MSNTWQFWIDVGGTFTDCFARTPEGRLRRHKLLSSGVVKGSTEIGSSRAVVCDGLRRADPPNFWRGWELWLVDAEGEVIANREVEASGWPPGELRLKSPLPKDVGDIAGKAYELHAPVEAAITGIRFLLGLAAGERLPPVSVRLGTTLGTNALLTRCGARTAFVTTRGFGDLLRIGYQNRPKLFDLAIEKTAPLFEQVIEVAERIDASGQVIEPLDENSARAALSTALATGIESLAICLLHAYRSASHERRLAEIAREVGFREVSLSSESAPLIKVVARGDTTVVDAYLNPVIRKYLTQLRASLANSSEGDIRVLTSAGGLTSGERFSGKDSILSGPAGGVVGFAQVAERAGFTRAIGFDMGGTSTDVSRYDGRYELEYEAEKAGVRIVAPMLAIETVAAGGGSICWFDGAKPAVGPRSAGASPGPACYGRGGPLAITDVNLYLGRLLPKYFPFPLDRAAVERRLAALADEIDAATRVRYALRELAEGLLAIANANMAAAIRSVSLARGYDPRDYLLVPFGGAAAQHACAVARELGMTRILNHPDAGLLSALGIGLANVVRHAVRGVYRPLVQAELKTMERVFRELIAQAEAEVEAEGISRGEIEVERLFDLRYFGQVASITIPFEQLAVKPLRDCFAYEHERLYGYTQERPLEIVAARVTATGRSSTALPRSIHAPAYSPEPYEEAELWFSGHAHCAPVYRRAELRAGAILAGPCVVVEPNSTTIVDPGWRGAVLTGGELLLAADAKAEGGVLGWHTGSEETQGGAADPVSLELFNQQFTAIARQMGLTLRNTASSTNVKERLDFSCALFTARGELVVNAPHVPVHLGAMGETVRLVLEDNPDLAPGDVVVTNDPFRGGSHLPDITVVSPVFDPAGGALRFFTASRAHHAEIGGIRPGSMPPFSRTLAEEGVLIRNFRLVDGGISRAEELRFLLSTGSWPSRAVEDNLADIAAQVAANRQGARDLERLIASRGWPVVQSYMRHVQEAAETHVRRRLAEFAPGERRFTDYLDDGTPITVAVRLGGGEAEIDFSGSGGVHPGNLNANPAIVTAAVLYVLRSLLAQEIPLNQGVLKPVRLVLPPGLLNPPAGETAETSPAVVGGNVETSQRIVDVLLGALGVAAASQGTMNNLLFGDSGFGYYETVCGGSGATPQHPGADAVHTHMTNTRLTDPEILEQRYPVRLRRFAIRRGSGGKGLHCGGDGVVREIEFLRPLQLSLLTQRRGPYPPWGCAGGEPGSLGENRLLRAGGEEELLPEAAQLEVAAGDRLLLLTPGGGGWGPPPA